MQVELNLHPHNVHDRLLTYHSDEYMVQVELKRYLSVVVTVFDKQQATPSEWGGDTWPVVLREELDTTVNDEVLTLIDEEQLPDGGANFSLNVDAVTVMVNGLTDALLPDDKPEPVLAEPGTGAHTDRVADVIIAQYDPEQLLYTDPFYQQGKADGRAELYTELGFPSDPLNVAQEIELHHALASVFGLVPA